MEASSRDVAGDKLEITIRIGLFPQQCNGGHVCVPNQSCGRWIFSYANAFFYSNKFAQTLATRVKTLYGGNNLYQLRFLDIWLPTPPLSQTSIDPTIL